MRVPTISKYSTATYQLGVITSDLKDANDVMSTQKKINTLSDDPIGMTQVLDLKESVKHLEQIETNVEMGRTWLTGVESSLKSTNDIILSVKNDVLRYANASFTSDNRKDAIDNINNVIEQIVSLGNTQVNGSYIFSGSSTNVKPIEYYPDENPPRIDYAGDVTAFKIRSDKNAEIPVGRVGSEVFWEDKVTINATNNTITFQENPDPNLNSDYTRTVTAEIPAGEYDNETLIKTIRNEMNDASAKDGYGVKYEVKYNEDTKQFSIVEDGSYKGYMATEFLWDTSNGTDNKEAVIKQDAYVDGVTAGGSVILDDINPPRIYDIKAINISEKPETFKLTRSLELDVPSNTYYYYWGIENSKGIAIPKIDTTVLPLGSVVTYESNGGPLPSKIVGNADGVDIYFDNDIDSNGNSIPDINISFNNSVSKDDYVEFTINPAKEIVLEDTSIGHEIGFAGENILSAPHTSDKPLDPLPPNRNIVANTNDKIDFQEVIGEGENRTVYTLTASVKAKNYTNYDELATEVEKAMEAESLKNGNRIDYAVSWDDETKKFSIKEKGTNLDEFNLLWQSGKNAPIATGGTTGYSIGETLGFNAEDDTKYLWKQDRPEDIGKPVKFREPVDLGKPVERGILNTLIDLAGYLKNNDVDGIERTIGRLDSSYNHITSVMADTGMKYSRLETRKVITSEMNLNLNERRASIEDADIVEAIMNLNSAQSAYEAALGSTAKIMKTSLMDYI
ncbi:MAG: flagellar hook-associated protein FlgL [Desulfamplus sp.]|nr:flagellar hook-associated protein FlgL [Desulfamplus sp.]